MTIVCVRVERIPPPYFSGMKAEVVGLLDDLPRDRPLLVLVEGDGSHLLGHELARGLLHQPLLLGELEVNYRSTAVVRSNHGARRI